MSIIIVAAQAKEVRIYTIFRYAHVYPTVLRLVRSGKIKVKPIITDTYPFDKGIQAFDYACNPKTNPVKVQIELP